MPFFELSLVNSSVESYYKTAVILKMEYGYSMSDINDMIPFELEITVNLIAQRMQEKKKARGM